MINGKLGDLQPVHIEMPGKGHPDLDSFHSSLQQYHYLKLRNSVGENLRYMARDRMDAPRHTCCVELLEQDGSLRTVSMRVKDAGALGKIVLPPHPRRSTGRG